MKKLLYVFTGLCLLAGLFTCCEKKPLEESDNSNGGGTTPGGTSTEQTSIISGVVIDKETGDPLSGVTIELQPTGKYVQTAEDGTYILDSLKANTYTIKAQKNGYNDYVSEKIRLGVKQTLTLDIVMEASTLCTLQGEVTDKETSSPLSGVTIELQPIGKQVQTTEDGTYRFDGLEDGTYMIKAQKEGYADYAKHGIKLTTGQSLMLDIEMAAPFVEFQIIDEKEILVEELGCYETERFFNLFNAGNIAGEWSIEADADWIEFSPKSGGLEAGAYETIKLTIDWRKMSEGENKTKVILHSLAGDKQWTVISYKPLSVGSSYVETSFGMELQMVAVQGGVFRMGATAEQGSDADRYEEPVHSVTLDGFYIGKYEVTQAQWKAVMGTTVKEHRDKVSPSYKLVGVGDNYPMYYVSWEEAVAFCEKLSEMTGKTYRLPTEAEWEYAARGGNKSQHYKYAGSNDPDKVAWYGEFSLNGDGSTNGSTHGVGYKKANELGIYDMSGNVVEWCSDWSDWPGLDYYSSSPAVNPQGPSSGSSRVRRGGSWFGSAVGCRVSCRGYSPPDNHSYVLGFRVACSAE